MARRSTKPKLEVKSLNPVSGYLSSGCYVLDLALSNVEYGGFPCGRVTKIFGDESTAKTVVGAEAVGSAQRQGGRAIIADAEQTFDLERAEQIYGVTIPVGDEDSLFRLSEDCDSVLSYFHPESIAELFDLHIAREISLRKDSKLKGPWAILVDSMSSLPATIEGEKLDAKSYKMEVAKMLSGAFREYRGRLNSNNIATIVIDQTRVKVGASPFLPKHRRVTTSGGRALAFYASARVFLDHNEILKNKKKQPVGVEIRFLVDKNKVAPPHRSGFFSLWFDYGIDDELSSINFLYDIEAKELTAKKASYEIFGVKARNRRELARKIQFAEKEEELRVTVWNHWQKLYETEERKPKVRR